MSEAATTPTTPRPCVCEDPLPNPAPPPASDPSIIIALASAVALSQCEEQAALIADLAARKIRSAPDSAAVARLALNLPAAVAHPLFVRLARYVLAKPKPSAEVGQ